MKGIAKRAKLVIRGAIAGRRSARGLAQFDLGALGAEAAALSTAAHATFVVAVTVAVGAGIPYTIVWALYAMWRAP
jgi:hypothetical protein